MKLKTGYEIRKIGNESVLIFTGGNRVDLSHAFSLNPTAEFLLCQMKESITKKALVAGFAEKYGLSLNKAGKDVSAFLNRMAEHGFIE